MAEDLNAWLQTNGQPIVDEYIVAKDYVYRALGAQPGRFRQSTKWNQCANFRI